MRWTRNRSAIFDLFVSCINVTPLRSSLGCVQTYNLHAGCIWWSLFRLLCVCVCVCVCVFGGVGACPSSLFYKEAVCSRWLLRSFLRSVSSTQSHYKVPAYEVTLARRNNRYHSTKREKTTQKTGIFRNSCHQCASTYLITGAKCKVVIRLLSLCTGNKQCKLSWAAVTQSVEFILEGQRMQPVACFLPFWTHSWCETSSESIVLILMIDR